LQVSRFLLNTVCTNGHWNEQELENVQLDLSCVSTLPAGKAWNDAGNYKQRRAAAKPAACHTHSMHRRRSASYFGICDSYALAISLFMPNSRTLYSHALERRNSRRNTATWTQFSNFGASVPITLRLSGSNLARWTKPTISSFVPNFAVIGILCHINTH